uniref:Persulfide dioxygenase ETHE1, mitochondrial n=1 Tax=Setaria digitata TaxID=48799 RepID=A0A915Q4P7_9BILA
MKQLISEAERRTTTPPEVTPQTTMLTLSSSLSTGYSVIRCVLEMTFPNSFTLFESVSCTYTYLLGCSMSGKAIIIDPVLETVERDAKLIKELNLDPIYGANTHLHADHITGTGKLKCIFPQMKSVLSKHAGGYADVLVDEGQILEFGDQKVEVRTTPGHTSGCVTYVSHNHRIAFTGDTLLIRGCGRTDFQEGNSITLYKSIHEKIFSLPDDFLLYPAHDYKGFLLTTVGEEKKYNPRLTQTLEDFVILMKNLKLPYPKQIGMNINEVKGEVTCSDQERDLARCAKKSDSGSSEEMIELLEFERNVMLDTYADDVLFVLASGLGLERLILHHLHLYSDPQLLVFVINTTPQDDAYFFSCLRDPKVKCPPKIITADCSIKDRESLYMEGGVHFITSRILMLDLLQERVPVKHVAGIIVYRAHQLLSGFQESFILRLYREKKADGFVKAFSDNPGALCGMGVLQRLLNRLYVRRVRLLPRFDVDVKSSLDSCSPHMIEISPDLPHAMRRVQSILVDIIRTCVRELKQTAVPTDTALEEESMQPAAGLLLSALEIQLQGRQFSITEKQQRLLADLKQLRNLLYKAEELDPITLYYCLSEIRNSKDLITTNSGWLFTQTSSKLFAEVDKLCRIKSDTGRTVLEPPKWKVLLKVLDEIKMNHKLDKTNSKKGWLMLPAHKFYLKKQINHNELAILLIGAKNEVCRQLRDIITWGVKKFLWVQNEELGQDFIGEKGEIEPEAQPSWDPSQIILCPNNVEDKNEIVNNVKVLQKEFARRSRKRRRLFEEVKKKHDSGKQSRLMRFGIVQMKKTTKVSIVAFYLNDIHQSHW